MNSYTQAPLLFGFCILSNRPPRYPLLLFCSFPASPSSFQISCSSFHFHSSSFQNCLLPNLAISTTRHPGWTRNASEEHCHKREVPCLPAQQWKNWHDSWECKSLKAGWRSIWQHTATYEQPGHIWIYGDCIVDEVPGMPSHVYNQHKYLWAAWSHLFGWEGRLAQSSYVLLASRFVLQNNTLIPAHFEIVRDVPILSTMQRNLDQSMFSIPVHSSG